MTTDAKPLPLAKMLKADYLETIMVNLETCGHAVAKMHIAEIEGHIAALSATIAQQAARIEALERETAQLKARYTWAANELLAPDYGDNSTPDDAKQFGWIVYGWRRPRHRLAHTDEPRIWGRSIDAAIDEELTKPMGNYCAALSGTTPPQPAPSRSVTREEEAALRAALMASVEVKGIVGTTPPDGLVEALEAIRKEFFSMCEDTEDKYSVLAKDLEHKEGAFARGRIKEAKVIRNAMGDVIRAALTAHRGDKTQAIGAEVSK